MAAYRIEIDPSLCSSFGTCAELAPRVIAFERGGIASLHVAETDDESVLEAAACCPMGAISVFETAGGRQAA